MNKFTNHLKKSLVLIACILGMYSASAQDSIYLVSETIPDTVTYNTWFEYQVTYASTNITDTAIVLRVWNIDPTLGDVYQIGGPETHNMLKIKKINSYLQNGKFHITFSIHEVIVETFMIVWQNKLNTLTLEASTAILVSKKDTTKFFIKPSDASKSPSGSITNIFKTLPPNESDGSQLLVPTFKKYLLDLSKGYYDPFQDTTSRDTTKWYTKDTTYVYDIVMDTIRKTDTIIVQQKKQTCDTVWVDDIVGGEILALTNCKWTFLDKYDTSYVTNIVEIKPDTVNTTRHINTIEHTKIDYSIKQHIKYGINYGPSGAELIPTGSIIRIINDSLFEVYGEEFAGTNRMIQGYITAYNEYGGITEPLTLIFIVDLQAYLDGVVFKSTATPGEDWQARFSFADTIQTATDTIMNSNFTIPEWTTLKDTSYMVYYWKDDALKSNKLKAGNQLKAMVRDSIFVKTFIVEGTVPTSVLKSTLVSYDIIASVCRYDNVCTPPKKYTLTVADTATNIKIDEGKNQEIGFYPNPAQSAIQLQGEIQTVKIYDLLGNQKLVIKPQGSGEINISNLPVGVYIIELSGPSSTVTKKLMKE